MSIAVRNTLFFAIPVVLIAIAFAVKSPYMAFTVYAFLLLVGIAYFSSHAWLAGLDASRRVSGTMFQQGDTIDVGLTIHNKRGWPIPWIFVEDQYPRDMARKGDNARLAVLMPGRKIDLDYTLTLHRRGYHRIGPLIMESGDLFGLQRRFRTGVSQNYISVLPTIAYIDTFTISGRRPQGPVRISNRVYEDPTRIAGIREYQRGDPLNRIHWKATARNGRLFTKTLEASTVTGGTMVLDLREDNYLPEKRDKRVELAVTTTASIAYLLQMAGEQVGMLTNGFDAALVAQYDVEARDVVAKTDLDSALSYDLIDDRIKPLQVPTLKSSIQAQKIAENLARVLPARGLDIDQLILIEHRNLPRDAALLVVCPLVSERLALVLAEMKVIGFNVSVFIIDDRKAHDEAALLLAPHRINTFHITEARDLHTLSPQKIGH
ncbi:MAG: DUF58 domain-containing protein [Candidatus Hydrogenedentota bacterium]